MFYTLKVKSQDIGLFLYFRLKLKYLYLSQDLSTGNNSCLSMKWICDNKLQFDYFRHKLKKKPQNTLKWKSHELFEDIDLVKEYYGYSTSKAKAVLKILDEEQLKDIKQRLFKGGFT